jgi:hypothetical protein
MKLFGVLIVFAYVLFGASIAQASGQCSVSGKSGFSPGRGGEFCEPVETPLQCVDSSGESYCVELGMSCNDSSIPLDPIASKKVCGKKTRDCRVYDVAQINVDGACMAYLWIPAKGGSDKNVSVPEPNCGESSRNAAKCQHLWVLPPKGQRVVTGSVLLLAKEAASAADCSDPRGYSECVVGSPIARATQDCAVAYSKWNPINIEATSVAGRFKNWSHDRPRCAAIRFQIR